MQGGPNKGELTWAVPNHSRILQTLRNPRYTGAFVFGRTRNRRRADGRHDHIDLPREQWQVVIKDVHPGYIDWDRFEANQRRLTDNGKAFYADRRSGPPREGPALLQGRALCGLCGERMNVEYHMAVGVARGRPDYVCKEHLIRRGGKICQSVPGKTVDAAVGDLLVELVSPMSIEVTLAVQRELESRSAELDTVRRQHVERMRYETELARRRYMNVDPDNRLVANALEAEWNEKLRVYNEAATDYDCQAKERATALDEEACRRIRELAEQFPRVWSDPRVQAAERKRIFRLLVDDVTLIKGEKTITAHVRLSGGATRTLELPRPRSIAEIRKFEPEVVAEVNRLLDEHRDDEIVEILNSRGLRTGEGKIFKRATIYFMREAYNLLSHHERLRRQGFPTTRELIERYQVSESTIKTWAHKGLIKNRYPDGRLSALWEIPAGYVIVKGRQGSRNSARLEPVPTHNANEV